MGSFAPNGFGLFDMAGNVSEWVYSLHRPYPYDPGDGREDLSASGDRVLRGGAWFSYGIELYLGSRDGTDPSYGSGMGFRCASSPCRITPTLSPRSTPPHTPTQDG